MGNRIRVGMCTCSWGHEEGQGGLSPTSTEASSPGWRGARECDMCCGDRTATSLRRTCIRIATACSSAALLSIPHLFTKSPPSPPFPLPLHMHAFRNSHRLPLVRTRVQGGQRPCRSTLDCRSEASEPRAALRRSKSADARHRHSRRVHSHHGHRAAKPASAPSRVGHRHVRKDVHFADLMASRLLLRSARQQRQRRARSLCH